MTSMKLVQFSRSPTIIVHLCPKSFHLFNLGRPTTKEPFSPPTHTSPSPNDNQSVKRKYNPKMTIICYQVVLPSGWLLFSVLILSVFPLTSEASTIRFSVVLYSCMCSCPKVLRHAFYL